MSKHHSKQINKTLVNDLLAQHRIITDQVSHDELAIILGFAQQQIIRNPLCSFVEFGCYKGTSSLFLIRLLQAYGVQSKNLHVYDSFAGLPEKSNHDQSPAGTQFILGELLATKREFVMNFKKASLPLPTINKGWFNDFTPNDVPENICFAFLDGDYYQSVLDSLCLIERKLAKGAVIVVDDYQSEQLPGAKKAVDRWLSSKTYSLQTQASLAIIRT